MKAFPFTVSEIQGEQELKVKVTEQRLKGQGQQNVQKAHLHVTSNLSVQYESPTIHSIPLHC